MMTLRSFTDLLTCHGADLGRWPDAEKHAAQRFLTQSAEARNALERAHDLERMMDSDKCTMLESQTLNRMVDFSLAQPQAARKKPTEKNALSFLQMALWGGSVFAAAALVLFLVVLPRDVKTPPATQVVAEADVDALLHDLDQMIARQEREEAGDAAVLAELTLIQGDSVQRSGLPAAAADSDAAVVDDFLESLDVAPHPAETPSQAEDPADIWDYFMSDQPSPPPHKG